jgi:DNA-binding winged helix-turn-helix (wHTH) protein/Flp pilus assembly protein TadD
MPAHTPQGPEVFAFDDIRVDAAAHCLLRAGTPRALEPKAYAVLMALLQRPGEVLGKDELLDLVWGHRHVTPGVLTRVIAQIRRAIGDRAEAPRYIQTVHTLGYRFIGKLANGSTDAPEPADDREPDVHPHGPRRRIGERQLKMIQPARFEASKDSYTLGRRYWYERTPASLAKGLEHFRNAVEADPGNARAWCGLADSYLLLYEYADLPADEAFREARSALTAAQVLQPDLAEAYASQGLLEIELQHYALAISLLEQAVHLDPGLAHARAWHAMALTLDGRLAEAEAMLEEATPRDPANTVLLTTLSMNLVMQGRWDSAEQVLAGVRQVHPGFLETYWQLAWLRAQHGRLAAAHHVLRQAERAAGPSGWTACYLGHVALMCGLPDLAERAIAGAPIAGDFNFWKIRTDLYWTRGQLNEAIEFLNGLVVPAVDRSHHGALLAHAYALAGRRDEALAQYELAYPGDPAQGDFAMRPWDMTLGLGERANHVALLGGDHPRRAAIVAGLSAQMEHMRTGGVRLPALDYHSAVLCALEGERESSLRWLDRALDAGFADAMAFRRELVWQHAADPDALAERMQRMQSRLASERLRIEAAERPP